jgi:hypothetical protein
MPKISEEIEGESRLPGEAILPTFELAMKTMKVKACSNAAIPSM